MPAALTLISAKATIKVARNAGLTKYIEKSISEAKGNKKWERDGGCIGMAYVEI